MREKSEDIPQEEGMCSLEEPKKKHCLKSIIVQNYSDNIKPCINLHSNPNLNRIFQLNSHEKCQLKTLIEF